MASRLSLLSPLDRIITGARHASGCTNETGFPGGGSLLCSGHHLKFDTPISPLTPTSYASLVITLVLIVKTGSPLHCTKIKRPLQPKHRPLPTLL